jgi:hypothetical protein
LIDVLGALGMVLLLAAFLANLVGRLQADRLAYNALNAVGAGILAWYSVQLSVWAGAALWRLARALQRGNASG